MHGFGDLEAAIMCRLWERQEPVTVREVWTGVRQQRNLAYTTILTVMEKLYRKGWLERELARRAHRYRPLISREEFVAGLMRAALHDSGDRAQALTHFVGRMTLEESAALRSALNTCERRTSGQ